MVPPVSIFSISKTAHNSQKIVFKFPENYSRNSSFSISNFQAKYSVFCLLQLKFEIIHFSDRNIQIFKCPESIVFTISKSAHNSQRIVCEFPENHLRKASCLSVIFEQNIHFWFVEIWSFKLSTFRRKISRF